MADINISKFTTQVLRVGSTPSSPGFAVDEGQDPVDPSGNPQTHLPVTIAAAADGLSITDAQVLSGAGTTAQYIRGNGSLATFPSLTGFVPYTGATADVDLGTHDLTAERGTFQNNGSSDTLTVNHTSGSGYGIKVTKGGNNEALYVSKTSGSGNAMTVIGGRTSLVDLALSSVTNTAGDFLTISGGVVHKRTAAEVRTDIGAGTVTSVAALTLGTSGTDLLSTVANGTTTPVITLNVPTASATNRGALSSADWTTFNNKQNSLTNPVTGTGTAGQVAYFTGTTTISSESNLFWDATNNRLGIGTNNPGSQLLVVGDSGQLTGNYRYHAQFLQDQTTGRGIGLGFKSDEQLGIIFGETSGAASSIGFVTYSGSAWNEGMRIFSDGNVFIGSSPSNAGFKLDVNGTGRFSSKLTVLANSGGIGVDIVGRSADGFGFLTFKNNANNAINGEIGISDAQNMLFYTGASVKLTIASTGAATFSSSVTAASIIRSGGSSSQFLKADGSVDSTTYVPVGRTITINGTTQDLSADRTFNVGTVTSVTASSPLFSSGGTTPNITIQQASGSQSGFLSSTDWTTFNNKQNSLTNPVTGTGTTNYLPKFTGTSTIGNSLIFDNGTNVGIGTNNPTINGGGLEVSRAGQAGVRVSSTGSGGGGIEIGNANDTGGYIQTVQTGGMITFLTGNASSSAMTMFSDGNTFIGTSPSNAGFKLDVNGTGRFSNTLRVSPTTSPIIQLYRNANLGTNESAGILSFGGLNTSVFAEGAYIGAFAAGAYSTTQVPTYLTFGTTPSESTAPIERLRIHQNGNIVFKGQSTTTSAESLFQNTNSALNFYATDSISFSKHIGFFTNTTTAQERMRINSGGQVGIGSTATPLKMLQAFAGNGDGIATGKNATNDNLSANLFLYPSATATKKNWAISAFFTRQTTLEFLYSSSSTSDPYTTGTPIMTLDGATTNVLIGTTTDSGDKLRVAGNTFTDTITTLRPDTESKSSAWRLGLASSGTITPDRLIRISVGGVEYYIAAVEV
jgi:hypothetical protein